MNMTRKTDCAPVAVFVYNRPDKTRTLFESLGRNTLASVSEIYIFSDAARNEGSEERVREVRDYIDSIPRTGWFKNVNVLKAEVNRGLADSVIKGVTDLIYKYGRIIVLEDDLIVSPNFLTYMNECLDFYYDDNRIWSIDGYSHNPSIPIGYDNDVYLTCRASSWGWGTWKNRWDLVDWDVKDYNRFRFNPVANIHFSKGGNDLPSMLRAQMKGKIDSWAVRWCYTQSKNSMFSVVPIRTLVSNSGLDGSGTNCNDVGEGSIEVSDIDKSLRQWKCSGISVNRQLTRDFYNKHHLSIYIRLRDKIRELTRNRKI